MLCFKRHTSSAARPSCLFRFVHMFYAWLPSVQAPGGNNEIATAVGFVKKSTDATVGCGEIINLCRQVHVRTTLCRQDYEGTR
ncbi:hypothetical protein TSUD_235520 [Trifolium subterraneum]|nr:hypothetical protein TSUD_235520 [Trifolium subterraneum]